MALFRQSRSKSAEQSASAMAASASQIDGLIAEIRAMRLEIGRLTIAVNGLNAVRTALEAKTWMAFQARKAGRVAGGVARAASARRDALGRYVS